MSLRKHAAFAAAAVLVVGVCGSARGAALDPWAGVSARAEDGGFGGVYPQCDAGREALVRELEPCRECMRRRGGCPAGCCVRVVRSFNNQLFACRTGGCCARFLTLRGAEPRPFIAALEPVAAGERVRDLGACEDFSLDHAAACGPRCAIGYPTGKDGPALNCSTTGYALPALDPTFEGPVACATAAGNPQPVASSPPSATSAAPPRSLPSTQTLTTAPSGGDGNDGDDPACFPGDATAELEGGERVRMDALRVGDRVRVAAGSGAGAFSPVVGFTHAAAGGWREFVALRTACGGVLRATGGHYVHAGGGLRAAGAVQAGDTLLSADGLHARVVRVAPTHARGLYNPHTLHGDIVVDGFVASTYTTAVSPAVAHAALAPVRTLFRALGVGVSSAAGAPSIAAVAPGGARFVC